MGLEDYQKAIDSLVLGNQIYNSNVGLLNSLGYCYYKSGKKKEALEVLNASLKLISGQKGIRELISKIEKL